MIGIDIVAISRISAMIEKYGEKGIGRFLNASEIKNSYKNDTLNPQRVAGMWAAKESLVKALGTGFGKDISYKDIKIKHNTKGAPYFKIKKEVGKRLKIKSSKLSISHDGGFAIAVCVVKTKGEK